MPKRLRSNLMFEHASLMQSGFVQARMAPPVRAFSRVVVRSFDDGRDVGPKRSEVELDGSSASQYDVLAANPALDVTLYEEMSVAATTANTAGESGHECDVADANPSFDPTPYEVAQGEPHEAEDAVDQPEAVPAEPAATKPVATPSRRAPAQKPAAASNGTRQQVPVAQASSFTAREMDKLVQDEDFRADIDAILSATAGGAAIPAATQATGPVPEARRHPPVREEQPGQSRTRSHMPTPEEAARELSDAPSEHAIFDKIAENMKFATAYELPSVNLNRRFDNFDRQGPRQPPAARSDAQSKLGAAPAHTAPPEAMPVEAEQSPVTPTPVDDTPEVGTADRQEVEHAVPAAPPQTLRPYSEAEKVATYGDPRVDPEVWVAENVIDVQVPQLAGVPGSDGALPDTTVAFHKLGMRSLSDLFAAWELAGLMSKVMSFDNTYAVQSPHGEGIDAHAWAIAFDINAKWNPSGDEPLPMGTEGSVAELVEIANRHGFVWGGHDPRRKAGLHFELGQRT